MLDKSIADIRTDYTLKTLEETDVLEDPVLQFSKWWDEAVHSQIQEVNAMVLSTLRENGFPASRVVLLKTFDAEGFHFFTNYESDKGRAIALHPQVSLLFFWKELQRQVRIEGIAHKATEAESDEYFHSRPLGSQLGAWASPQSHVIDSRAELDSRDAFYTKKFGTQVPRPPHWGGYIVKPLRMEFWQGRASRLHDRILYTFDSEKNLWGKQRLAP